MKGYISKYDRAVKIAKSYGFKENAFGFTNVVSQVLAKLIVGSNTTIGRLNTGKLVLHKV